ncbi:cytochrome P450 302a1, mitochondrial-like isoform X2 [Babylonia areolata]
MPRFLLDSLCRQLLRASRGPFAARHWLAGGPRGVHATRDWLVCGARALTSSSAQHTIVARSKATSPSAVSERAALSEPWDNDVTEREVAVCPMTSPGVAEGQMVSDDSMSPTESFAAEVHVGSPTTAPVRPDTQDVRPPTPDAKASSTTVPPYLAFDTARPFSEMPAPLSLPVIGTMWMHMPGGPLHGMNFEQKTKRMQELYGSIIRETVLLGFTMVHVYRPEDIEAAYRMQGTRPRRDAFRTLHKYNTDYSDGVQGLLTSQGDEWHRLRSQAQVKMLKPKSASAYLHLHNQVSDDFVTVIRRLRGPDGVIDDLLPELYKFAMEGIGCVCFNRRLGALDANIPADSDTYRFIQSVSDVMEVTHSENKKPFLFRHSASFRKLVKAQSFIRRLSAQEAIRTLTDFTQTDRAVDGESGDLIPYLMTKTELTEQQVMTLISEFFFAGVDTTSHLLGFALFCLAKNPEVQENLIQEIDQLVPGSDAISANTLGRMSYLKGFTKETFRMMPITPGNGRTLPKDVVLSGYHVPAGTALGLHHDWAGKTEQYVREADRFEPQRWLRGNTSPLGHVHPFILMPFGFGSRACVGRRFAEQEYSLALIKILQNFRVEYAHTEDVWYEMCVVNKPMTPLKFRFVPRK